MPIRFEELVSESEPQPKPAPEPRLEKQERPGAVEAVAGAAAAREVEEIAAPANLSGHHVATITRIEKGRFRDFVNVERLLEAVRARGGEEEAERLLQRLDDDAYRIHFVVDDLGLKASKVVRVSFNPKSKLMKMLRLYGQRDESGRLVLRKGSKVVVKLYETPDGRLAADIETEDVAAVRELLGS